MQTGTPVGVPDYTDFEFAVDAQEIFGAQQRFRLWTFKGKTFHDVLFHNPSQYVSLNKVKKQSSESTDFVAWVETHYQVDKKTFEIVRVSEPEHEPRAQRGMVSAGSSSVARPCPGGCKTFHHKGSSARYQKNIRLVCKNVTYTERDTEPVLDPETYHTPTQTTEGATST